MSSSLHKGQSREVYGSLIEIAIFGVNPTPCHILNTISFSGFEIFACFKVNHFFCKITSSSHLPKCLSMLKQFAYRLTLVICTSLLVPPVLSCILTVSYTHLTLPT